MGGSGVVWGKQSLGQEQGVPASTLTLIPGAVPFSGTGGSQGSGWELPKGSS